MPCGKVFICYARADTGVALRLHGLLNNAAFSPWCADVDLRPDECWDEAIPRALGQADVVLVLISARWPTAGSRQIEDHYAPEDIARAIDYAHRHELRLVPVRLDGIGRHQIPYGLQRLTGVDARSEQLEVVVEALHRILSPEVLARGARSDQPGGNPDQLRGLEAVRERLISQGASSELLAAINTRLRAVKRARLHPRRPERGLVLGGRWLLLERLGRGGFAEVWLAADVTVPTAGLRAAVKILHPQFEDSSERRARFFRGARRMARLVHPHVVEVLEVEGVSEGFHYFVMEFMESGDLEAAIRSRAIDASEGLSLLLQIADAVSAAHSRGLIHRDIKPSNILLASEGVAKLADFDLVGAADTTGGTRTGALGTYIFAAPEALEDAGRVDERCDIHALGMTALFVLLGVPVPRLVLRSPQAVLEQVTGFGAVKVVVERAIRWEPEQRYESMSAFTVALEKALMLDTMSTTHNGFRLTAQVTDGDLTLSSIEDDGRLRTLHDLWRRPCHRSGAWGENLDPGYYAVTLELGDGRWARWLFRVKVHGEPVRLDISAETLAAMGPDESYIPAGPASVGGGDEAIDGFHPQEVHVDAFFMRRHPVTHGEYLSYVNDLAAELSPSALERYLPRHVSVVPGQPGPSLYVRSESGRFELPPSGGLDADVPVGAISWFAATAFARYTAHRTGSMWRLPREIEWEKAARGIDGRACPWGDGVHESLANVVNSRPGLACPVPVTRYSEAFPNDVSVFGVFGLGGNMRTWCMDEWQRAPRELDPAELREPSRAGEPAPDRLMVVRGAAWCSSRASMYSANRYADPAGRHPSTAGIRLVRSAPLTPLPPPP